MALSAAIIFKIKKKLFTNSLFHHIKLQTSAKWSCQSLIHIARLSLTLILSVYFYPIVPNRLTAKTTLFLSYLNNLVNDETGFSTLMMYYFKRYDFSQVNP